MKVVKFGGSSMADAGQYRKVRDILMADPERKVVVVSAAGKRFSGDHKLTDLLYLCYAHIQYGVDCSTIFDAIANRYIDIRDDLGLSLPIEVDLELLKHRIDAKEISQEELVSRGEYLSAKLMAAYLGFQFVDAADWVKFNMDGTVNEKDSYEALRSQVILGYGAVIPGFYGAMPDGTIHTFSRGGSDITGALAAAAVDADVYENWTDVPGVLEADPKLIPEAAPLARISYGQLQQLSEAGMQVLHEDAVAPVRRAGIPLNIRSTREPEKPGTMICEDCLTAGLALAGRRNLTLPGQPGTLALLAAAFPRDWDLTAALDQVDHVCLVREPGALRVLLADRDYPEAVRRLYDLGHSFHGYTVP